MIEALLQRIYRDIDVMIAAALRRFRPNLSGDVDGTLPMERGGTGNGRGTTKPSGSAGGDLGGSYPNPSVIALQGVAVSDDAPTDDQVLTFIDGEWIATDLPPDEGGGGGAPTGTAGGDLNGAYPNPTVDGIRAVGVHSAAATPTDGDLLVYHGSDNMWHVQQPNVVIPPPPDTYSYITYNGEYVMYNGDYTYILTTP